MAPRFNTDQFRSEFVEGDVVYKGLHLRQEKTGIRNSKKHGAKYTVEFEDLRKSNSPASSLPSLKNEINQLLSSGFSVHPKGYLYKENK